MAFFDSEVISTDRNQMIPNASLYEFGILNSAMHNDWMRVVTGRLEVAITIPARLCTTIFLGPKPTKLKKPA